MSDKCESCGVPFADHDGLIATCRKLKDERSKNTMTRDEQIKSLGDAVQPQQLTIRRYREEVVALREALEYIAWHAVETNAESASCDDNDGFWQTVAGDCIRHATIALKLKEKNQ